MDITNGLKGEAIMKIRNLLVGFVLSVMVLVPEVSEPILHKLLVVRLSALTITMPV